MITHTTLTNCGPHERLELTGLQPITLFVGHPKDGLTEALRIIELKHDEFRLTRGTDGLWRILELYGHAVARNIDYDLHYTELYDMWQRVFDMVLTDGKPNGKQLFASTQNYECFKELVMVMRDRYGDSIKDAPVSMVRIELGGISVARAEIMDAAYKMGLEVRGITPEYPDLQTHTR